MTSEANHTYVTYRISFAPKSICSCDADCGTSGFEGGNFCKDGNVYKNYRRSVCNNPGTSQSSCSSSIIPVFWYGCGYNQTCSNGYCIPKQHEEGCTCDTDCGANGFVDGNFCKDGNVYKNYKKNMCIGGSCSSALVPTLWYYCTDGQTCSSGYCHKAECANNGYGSFSCPHGS